MILYQVIEITHSSYQGKEQVISKMITESNAQACEYADSLHNTYLQYNEDYKQYSTKTNWTYFKIVNSGNVLEVSIIVNELEFEMWESHEVELN